MSPAGGPTNSTILYSLLLKNLTGHPSCSQCPGRLRAFLKDVVSLVFWQTKDPPLLSLFMLGEGTLRVPGRDPHPRMTLPLGHRRSHASLACIALETSPTYQGIYSAGGCHCGCWSIGIGHSPLPGSTSWYPALVCGWFLMPAGGLLWPPGEPHHVSFSSHGTWTELLVSWVAGRWGQVHCNGPSSCRVAPPASTNTSSVRTRCPE